MMDPAHYLAEYDLVTPSESVAASRVPVGALGGTRAG
jgi:hypothetical protein